MFCLPLIDTVVQQIQLIVPHRWSTAEEYAVREADAAGQADRRANNASAMFHQLRAGNPTSQELQTWAKADPGNSLAAWAVLLVRLREAGVSAGAGILSRTQPSRESFPATQPAVDESFVPMLQDLLEGPPLRTSTTRYHEIFIDTLRARGISARRAEFIFDSIRWQPPFSDYRPVIRELSDRLLALGRAYARQGNQADAKLAYAAAVRALTDVVQDSPIPEVALLAAERLPVAIREFSKTANAAGGEDAASAVEHFRQDWLNMPVGEISLLPNLAIPAPAPAEQAQVLRTLVLAIGFLACGWLLALLCFVHIAIILATRHFGPVTIMWRQGARSVAAAAALAVLPAVIVLLIMASGYLPFPWLFSNPSLGTMVLLPSGMFVCWLLAVAIFIRPLHGAGRPLLPTSAILGGLSFVAAAVLLVAAMIHWYHESWRPPMPVQIFRNLGVVASLANIPVLTVWIIWARQRTRSSGLPVATWARGGLAVASSAMLIMLFLAVIALGANARRDHQYDQSFAVAVNDPISSRMGSDWWEHYFAKARALIDERP